MASRTVSETRPVEKPTRRQAREQVLKALYSVEIGKNEINEVARQLIQLPLRNDAKLSEFARMLFIRTLDTGVQNDQIIARHIRNWELGRLATIDRLVLRMALTELLEFPDVPVKVTLNEAIEIGSLYSTANSGRFINGILDAALKELESEGRIRKQGRGLDG